MTAWQNLTTFEAILLEANRHAPFWTGILLMMWVVLVVTFLPFGTHVAILGGSFSAFMLGLLLGYMGLVSWKIILMMAGVIIVIVIIDALFAKKDQ
jgi:hypothetical protein